MLCPICVPGYRRYTTWGNTEGMTGCGSLPCTSPFQQVNLFKTHTACLSQFSPGQKCIRLLKIHLLIMPVHLDLNKLKFSKFRKKNLCCFSVMENWMHNHCEGKLLICKEDMCTQWFLCRISTFSSEPVSCFILTLAQSLLWHFLLIHFSKIFSLSTSQVCFYPCRAFDCSQAWHSRFIPGLPKFLQENFLYW